jgi:hypothetical protein
VSFHYSLVNLKSGSTSVKAPGGKFPLGRFLMMSTREEETTFNIHIPQKGTYLLEIGRIATTTFQIVSVWNCMGTFHKVLTYLEYRAVSDVFQNIDPHPPLQPASVSSPRTKGGGYTLAGR